MISCGEKDYTWIVGTFWTRSCRQVSPWCGPPVAQTPAGSFYVHLPLKFNCVTLWIYLKLPYPPSILLIFLAPRVKILQREERSDANMNASGKSRSDAHRESKEMMGPWLVADQQRSGLQIWDQPSSCQFSLWFGATLWQLEKSASILMETFSAVFLTGTSYPEKW